MLGNDERAGEPCTTERGEEGKIARGRGGEERGEEGKIGSGEGRGEKGNKGGSPGLPWNCRLQESWGTV